jgi:hypothetical protein
LRVALKRPIVLEALRPDGTTYEVSAKTLVGEAHDQPCSECGERESFVMHVSEVHVSHNGALGTHTVGSYDLAWDEALDRANETAPRESTGERCRLAREILTKAHVPLTIAISRSNVDAIIE